MTTEKFGIAEDELEALLEMVESDIDLITDKRRRGNPEGRRHCISTSRSKLNDAKGLIQEMQREAQSAPSQFRNEMVDKVRQFRQKMSELQIRLNQAADLAASKNVQWSDDVGGSGLGLSEQERVQQQATQLLGDAAQGIVNCQRVADETEQIGGAIITELESQRGQLENARDRLQETDAELSKADRIVARLKLSTIYNKIFLIFIIIIELCIVVALIIWKCT